jgi:hypothetical protein
MSRVLITTDENARLILAGYGDQVDGPIVEVVTISEIDGIHTLNCTGHDCGEIEPGDTWSNLEDCIEFAQTHVARAESGPVVDVEPKAFAHLILIEIGGTGRTEHHQVKAPAVIIVDEAEYVLTPFTTRGIATRSMTFEVRS